MEMRKKNATLDPDLGDVPEAQVEEVVNVDNIVNETIPPKIPDDRALDRAMIAEDLLHAIVTVHVIAIVHVIVHVIVLVIANVNAKECEENEKRTR